MEFMNLGANVIRQDAVYLSDDKKAFVKNLCNRLLTMSYWHPEYQAWWIFIEHYLTHGSDHELTRSMYLDFVRNQKTVSVPNGPTAKIFDEYVKFHRNASGLRFRGIEYSRIVDFTKDRALWYVYNLKTIRKQIFNAEFSENMFKTLAGLQSPDSIVPLYMGYRCIELDTYNPVPVVRPLLEERVESWVDEYSKHFKEVQKFLDGEGGEHSFYCDETLDIIQYCWYKLLDRGAMKIIDHPKLSSLTQYARDTLLEYINDSPCFSDLLLRELVVWNAIEHLYFRPEEMIEDAMIRASWVLCLKKPRLRRVADLMESLITVVKNEDLTTLLYIGRSGKEPSFDEENFIDADEYLHELYTLGFPKIKKGV